MKKNDMICVPLSWKELEKDKYNEFGLVDAPTAKVEKGWLLEKDNNITNIVSMYNFGKDEKLIANLSSAFKELMENDEAKKQYNLNPIYCEDFVANNKNCYFSALKTGEHQSVVVDIYFTNNANVYSLHTVVKEINGKSLDEIKNNNELIGLMIKAIENKND